MGYGTLVEIMGGNAEMLSAVEYDVLFNHVRLDAISGARQVLTINLPLETTALSGEVSVRL